MTLEEVEATTPAAPRRAEDIPISDSPLEEPSTRQGETETLQKQLDVALKNAAAAQGALRCERVQGTLSSLAGTVVVAGSSIADDRL